MEEQIDVAAQKERQEQAGQEEQAKQQVQDSSLEALLTEVEGIITQLQQRDISLENSFMLYQQGIEKLKKCNEKIDHVEKKLLILNEEGQLV